MIQSETRYEIMEGEDGGGFIPAGYSDDTLEEAEALLQELRETQPEVYPNAFICQTVTTRLTARKPGVSHQLQTIPAA